MPMYTVGQKLTDRNMQHSVSMPCIH